MRARTRLLTAALACGVSLTGCNAVNKHAPEQVAVPADARPGGVLRVGITAPAGIDPLNAYEPVGEMISAALCDTVVAIDPITGQLRSALAEKWVQSSGSDVTIKLKHGIKFSDGSELKEKDVNFSLQQLVAPANGSYAAGLAKQFTFSVSGGTTDVLDDPNKAANVANPINNYDFQLASIQSNAGALRSLAEPAMAPVSRDATTKAAGTSTSNPICVGPYVLTKPYKDGDPSITLKRSKAYYASNAGYTSGGAGYADEIDFTVYPSTVAALAAYSQGKIDVLPLSSAYANQIKDPRSLLLGPATGVEYIGMPLGSSNAFSDVNLRLALSEAIDRTTLVAQVFGSTSVPANGFLPPTLTILQGTSLPGKTAKAAPLGTCGSATPATADLDAAKAHLQADASAPKSFTLEVNSDSYYPAMANALAAQWKANLGIDVKVDVEPWTTYLPKATQSSGFETPFRIRWSSDAGAPAVTYNDQFSYLTALFNGDASGGADWTHWGDRDFQYGLSNDAAGITDTQRRGVAFAQLAQRLCDQMPLIPLAFQRPAFLVRATSVGSATPAPVGRDGILSLRELYLKAKS